SMRCWSCSSISSRTSSMAGSIPASLTADALGLPRPRSLAGEAWHRFRRHRLALVGAGVLAVIAAAVLFGPLAWRTPVDEIDFRAKLRGPSVAHPFGTDDLGQDLLARMLHGGRISLAVGVVAMLISLSVGVVVGAVSGFYGGPA